MKKNTEIKYVWARCLGCKRIHWLDTEWAEDFPRLNSLRIPVKPVLLICFRCSNVAKIIWQGWASRDQVWDINYFIRFFEFMGDTIDLSNEEDVKQAWGKFCEEAEYRPYGTLTIGKESRSES